MRTSRRGAVDPFIVMDVMEAARQAEEDGRHIIHMEVGQPGTPAPSGARAALATAMEEGALGYTVALGLPELRAKIAERYRTRHNVDLDPNQEITDLLLKTWQLDKGSKAPALSPQDQSLLQVMKASTTYDGEAYTTSILWKPGEPAFCSKRYQVINRLDQLLAGKLKNPDVRQKYGDLFKT